MMSQSVTMDSRGRTLRRFGRFMDSGQLAHAYLLAGPRYSEKFATCLDIARLVNCEERDGGAFCGRCVPCVKISHGNHPDIHVIGDDEEASIKIEKIRLINAAMQLRNFEAAVKVFIIKNVERLNMDAANAFLKTLEEPSGHSLILLTTSALEKNLDTIRSRCQLIHFAPPGPESVKRRLIKEKAVDEAAAQFLAHFTDGSWERSRELVRRKMHQKKNGIIDRFMFEADEADLKKVLSDKEKVKDLLNLLLSWFRDILLVQSGMEPQRLIHPDRYDDLKRLAGLYAPAQIESIIRDIVEALRLWDENLNVKLPVTLIQERLLRNAR